MPIPLAKVVALSLMVAVLLVVLAPSTNLGKTALRGKTFAKMIMEMITLASVLFAGLILSLLPLGREQREWLQTEPAASASLLELNCVHRC